MQLETRNPQSRSRLRHYLDDTHIITQDSTVAVALYLANDSPWLTDPARERKLKRLGLDAGIEFEFV